MNRIRSTKGITLIALIITIIVLLILAGISVNMLFGEKGVVTKSQWSAFVTEMAKIEENVELKKADIAAEERVSQQKINLFDETLEERADIELPDSFKQQVMYVREGKPSDKSPLDYEPEEINLAGIYVIEENTGNGKKDTYAYDEISGKVFKIPQTNIGKKIYHCKDSDINISYEEIDNTPKVPVPASDYKKMGSIYYYSPDLSKFDPSSTYYVIYDENGQNEQIGGRIDRVEEPKSGWHDYENKIWGNVVTVNGNNVTYWSWIPRYAYSKESDNSANVHFVDLEGKSKIYEDGQDKEVDVSALNIPESFTFGDQALKGYWISKYEVQLPGQAGIEQLVAKQKGKKLDITTTNPTGKKYTIYENGVKTKENVDLPISLNINNNKNDICVYCETDKRMIGRTGGLGSLNIEVDTSGFNPSNTYYVTYDENGNNEEIYGRMDKVSEPDNWYNYEKKIWANLVTVNEHNVTYWTYIPRYEYIKCGESIVTQFIPSTKTVADSGYNLPESFTFGDKPLKGYWISKYEVQVSSLSGLEQIVATTDEEGKLTVSTSSPSGTYTIFVNGEKKYENVDLPKKIDGISGEYDVVVYSETNKRMVGSTEGIVDVIEVDLSGFEPSTTRYVTYDADGNNEQIGENIELDEDGKPTNMPENWYNYSKKIWANVVTENNGLTTYWTYIPRYEYAKVSSSQVDVHFIPVTKTEPDGGYAIPESFIFGDKQLKGYWVSKYEVQGTID